MEAIVFSDGDEDELSAQALTPVLNYVRVFNLIDAYERLAAKPLHSPNADILRAAVVLLYATQENVVKAVLNLKSADLSNLKFHKKMGLNRAFMRLDLDKQKYFKHAEVLDPLRQRRHDIVHEADRIDGRTQQSISVEQVQNWLDLSQRMTLDLLNDLKLFTRGSAIVQAGDEVIILSDPNALPYIGTGRQRHGKSAET